MRNPLYIKIYYIDRFYLWECKKDNECKFGVTSKTVQERIESEIFFKKNGYKTSDYIVHVDIGNCNAHHIEAMCIKLIKALGLKKDSKYQERFINETQAISKVSSFANLIHDTGYFFVDYKDGELKLGKPHQHCTIPLSTLTR
jgi:hypothetical protein